VLTDAISIDQHGPQNWWQNAVHRTKDSSGKADTLVLTGFDRRVRIVSAHKTRAGRSAICSYTDLSVVRCQAVNCRAKLSLAQLKIGLKTLQLSSIRSFQSLSAELKDVHEFYSVRPRDTGP
jgi:hypothetical protein